MSKPDLFRNGHNPYVLICPATKTRDRRLDLLRGLAVLGISANHIWPEGISATQFARYEFGHLFAFDFADVFVLLSGIVAGLVFFTLLVQGGLKQCYKKSAYRAGQIWAAQLLCVFAALPIIRAFEQALRVTGSLLSPFDHSTLAAFAGNILLYNPSIFLDILPVYIMLLLLLPLALMLFRRAPIAYFFLIGSIWAVLWVPVFLSGAGAIAPLTSDLKTPYFMHPLSAQLLFFTGVAIGIRKRKIEAFLAHHGKTVLRGAIAFLLVTNYMAQMKWMVHHFDQKHFAEPLRPMELLAVISVIWSLTGQHSFSSKTGLVEICGRHSLPVFAVTSVGAVFFTYLVNWLEAGRLIYGLCILANVVLCLACGYLLERRKISKTKVAHGRTTSQRPRTRHQPLDAQTA